MIVAHCLQYEKQIAGAMAMTMTVTTKLERMND